jgi:hypothetical protein
MRITTEAYFASARDARVEGTVVPATALAPITAPPARRFHDSPTDSPWTPRTAGMAARHPSVEQGLALDPKTGTQKCAPPYAGQGLALDPKTGTQECAPPCADQCLALDILSCLRQHAYDVHRNISIQEESHWLLLPPSEDGVPGANSLGRATPARPS